MKRLALAAVMAALPTMASADVIRCSFTEPFLSMTYSMTQSSIEIVTPDGNETVPSVSFQILGPGQFALWDKDEAPLVTLNLDYRGSDGMSDTIFPFSAIRPYGDDGQHGGCWSNHLPRVGGEQ